ncbi:MAG: pro-sigmaK processing inhibitor BofA family protein [Clostridiaceae bacterium]|nr:pro-sigmaK processing inhibitor BofA family protein [Clostridiaceae bacterium]
MEKIVLYVAIGIAVLIVMRIFTLPVKWIFKLLLNTVLGFVGLFLVNWLGSYIGISLGINVVNAVVVGTFGIPGMILLLLLRWLFAV